MGCVDCYSEQQELAEANGRRVKMISLSKELQAARERAIKQEKEIVASEHQLKEANEKNAARTASLKKDLESIMEEVAQEQETAFKKTLEGITVGPKLFDLAWVDSEGPQAAAKELERLINSSAQTASQRKAAEEQLRKEQESVFWKGVQKCMEKLERERAKEPEEI